MPSKEMPTSAGWIATKPQIDEESGLSQKHFSFEMKLR